MEASWWERLTEGETGSCSDGWGHAQKIFNLRDPISPSYRKSVLNIHWKDWYRSWTSNTLATWCEELTLWKRPWCWERLKAGEEADDRGWDGWMASPTQWTWVWINSGSWWWIGRTGMLQSMGSQRAGHDWAAELHWIHILHRPHWTPHCFTTSLGLCLSWMSQIHFLQLPAWLALLTCIMYLFKEKGREM